LVEGVGHGIAKLAIRQDLRGDVVEPCLESVEDGNAVLLAEAADAVISRFAVVGDFIARLSFNPVELFEELQRLFRWPATFLSCLEGIDEASPRMSYASQMGCALQRAPGGIPSLVNTPR
jgi:hypothetical protein